MHPFNKRIHPSISAVRKRKFTSPNPILRRRSSIANRPNLTSRQVLFHQTTKNTNRPNNNMSLLRTIFCSAILATVSVLSTGDERRSSSAPVPVGRRRVLATASTSLHGYSDSPSPSSAGHRSPAVAFHRSRMTITDLRPIEVFLNNLLGLESPVDPTRVVTLAGIHV